MTLDCLTLVGREGETVNENETVDFGNWCRSSVSSGAMTAMW
jgi:hypothetical protein